MEWGPRAGGQNEPDEEHLPHSLGPAGDSCRTNDGALSCPYRMPARCPTLFCFLPTPIAKRDASLSWSMGAPESRDARVSAEPPFRSLQLPCRSVQPARLGRRRITTPKGWRRPATIDALEAVYRQAPIKSEVLTAAAVPVGRSARRTA